MEAIYRQRMDALREAAGQAGLAGVIVHQPAYLFHLTGWSPPGWVTVYLVVGPRATILVAPFVPEGAVVVWDDLLTYTAFSLDEVVDPLAQARAALEQAIAQTGLHGLPTGAALASLPAAVASPLAEQVQWRDAGPLFAEITVIKDSLALAEIRRRVAMLDRGFERSARTIRAGVTELEVFGAIYTTLAQELEAPLTLDCVFASGPRTLLFEPQPTNKRLAHGEVVLIDLFPNLGGYVADYTRNFVVGEPTRGQTAQHAVLMHALTRAEEMLRPGVTAAEIDQAVRGVIAKSAFAAYGYGHLTGHGFGLTTPEAPLLLAADHTPLRAGMVIAVEPGIYHPEQGGMRLEGNYIITEDGCESLAGYPPVLTACW